LLLIGLVCLGLAVFLVSELVTLPAKQRSGSLRRASSWGRTARPVVEQRIDPLAQRTLQPLKEKLARGVLRLNPKANVEQVSFRILVAGLNRRISPTGFLSSKAFLSIGGIVMGFLLGSGSGGAMLVMMALGFGAVGFIGPDMYLNSRLKSRRDKVLAEL